MTSKNIMLQFFENRKHFFKFVTVGSKLANICGAPHLLQMVTFMDISAISKPILIK